MGVYIGDVKLSSLATGLEDSNTVKKAVNDIKAVLVEKGVEVPEGTGLSDLAKLCNELSNGTALKSLIQRSITEIDTQELTKIGAYAFAGCTSLVTANLGQVSSIDTDAFNGCTNLKTVHVPIASSIRSRAFMSCTSLVEIHGENVMISGVSSFFACTSLETVDFPKLNADDSDIFNGCSVLKNVNLPSTKTLGNNAFNCCYALEEVDFPILTKIGSAVFSSCSSLKVIVLRKSDAICTLSNTNAFKNTPIASGTGYIYVPRALVDTYKTATNWSTYANQFRALEDYTVDGTITGKLDMSKI